MSSDTTLSPTAFKFVPTMTDGFILWDMINMTVVAPSFKRISVDFQGQKLADDADTFYKESRCDIDLKKEQDDFINYVSFCVTIINAQCNGYWDIFPFGSAVWKIQTKESDIDLAIEMKQSNVSRTTKQNILRKIMKMIKGNKSFEVEDVTFARYPIIKIKDKVHGIDMDLSVADEYCQKTTQYISSLINDYEQFGIPVRKFIIFIKDWSKKQKVNNALKCYLNSFGYTLMSLHFVHCLMNHKNVQIVYEATVTSFGCLCKLLRKASNLIAGFFLFYGWTFDPHLNRIDITQKQLLCGKRSGDLLEIVDPLNSQNNVAKNVGIKQWNDIQSAMKRTYNNYICIENENENNSKMCA